MPYKGDDSGGVEDTALTARNLTGKSLSSDGNEPSSPRVDISGQNQGRHVRPGAQRLFWAPSGRCLGETIMVSRRMADPLKLWTEDSGVTIHQAILADVTA